MSSNMMMANNGGVSATGSNQPASQPAITLSTSALPQAVPSKLQKKAKRRRKCGLCGLHGHNRRTCKANPKAKPAGKPKGKPEPSRFPAKKGDYVVLVDPIESMFAGKRVMATYRGSDRKYPATIHSVDEKTLTICLKYDDGDIWTGVPWFKPFENHHRLCQVSTLTEKTVEVKTPTGTQVVPLERWYQHILPYKVEIQVGGKWERMEEDIAVQLLRAHALQKCMTQYSAGSKRYNVYWDFKNGELLTTGAQINVRTRSRRPVRLVGFTAPKKQRPLLDTKRFPIVKASELLPKYSKQLSSIAKEYYVQDLKALNQNELLSLIVTQEEEKGNNTKTEVLFHGTSIPNIRAIIKQGFQQTRKKNGRLYGEGIYVTDQLFLASEYANSDKLGRRAILVCDVLVGDRMITKRNTTMLKPGFRTGGDGEEVYMKPWVYRSDIALRYLVVIFETL